MSDHVTVMIQPEGWGGREGEPYEAVLNLREVATAWAWSPTETLATLRDGRALYLAMPYPGFRDLLMWHLYEVES